nr:unnamed protein product [Callosobruchus chinensis]
MGLLTNDRLAKLWTS